jgi:hypothetical protein
MSQLTANPILRPLTVIQDDLRGIGNNVIGKQNLRALRVL